MDITSLIVPIGLAIKEKATGVAVKWLTEAVTERAQRLWGVIDETNHERFARRMVAEVMAEAAQYPPEKALQVIPLGTQVGSVGIWGPRGTLRLNLLWVNRADFPIHVRELRVTVKAGGVRPEWERDFAEEFPLGPREVVQRTLEIEPQIELPVFERGGANCDASLTAVVCGPWDEGRAQRTQELVPLVGIWLPVVGFESAAGLLDVADIDIKLETYLRRLQAGYRLEVTYAVVDRELGLRAGAVQERLGSVAQRLGYEVAAGPSVASVHRPKPPPSPSRFLRRPNRMDGW